jgi:nicotinate dehydrogenase subunit B
MKRISRALKQEVTFSGRSITSSDWRGYPVLRFTEAPDAIEIVTLDSDHPSLGAGEPPNVLP